MAWRLVLAGSMAAFALMAVLMLGGGQVDRHMPGVPGPMPTVHVCGGYLDANGSCGPLPNNPCFLLNSPPRPSWCQSLGPYLEPTPGASS